MATDQSSERIAIIDAIRGIAVIGILFININAFGRPWAYFMNFTLDNESDLNYYVWWITNSFFSGSMRALFSLLFGASAILLLHRLETRDHSLFPADIYYRRMLILLGFAMVNGFVLLWYGDILFSYAICGLFLFPFRNLKPGLLLIIGLSLLLLPDIRDTYNLYQARKMRTEGERAVLTEQQGKTLNSKELLAKRKWVEHRSSIEVKKQEIQLQKAVMLKDYISIAKDNIHRTIVAHTEHFYSQDFWDVIPFFFIGMAFFKLGILTGERSKGFYWVLTIAGIGLGSMVAYRMLTGYIKANFDTVFYADFIGADLFQAKRFCLAIGYIGFIMLFYKYKLTTGLLYVFSKVGQMTLTTYMMQSVILAIIFYGFGFGLYGLLERYELYYVVFAVGFFQVLFGNIWMKHFRYGPIEWVWRCLTYWEVQPIRKRDLSVNLQ